MTNIRLFLLLANVLFLALNIYVYRHTRRGLSLLAAALNSVAVVFLAMILAGVIQ